MMDRSLAHAKDPLGNNLLHLAAKNRNEELFAFLIKKTGPSALTANNNVYHILSSWAELLST